MIVLRQRSSDLRAACEAKSGSRSLHTQAGRASKKARDKAFNPIRSSCQRFLWANLLCRNHGVTTVQGGAGLSIRGHRLLATSRIVRDQAPSEFQQRRIGQRGFTSDDEACCPPLTPPRRAWLPSLTGRGAGSEGFWRLESLTRLHQVLEPQAR